MILKKLLSVIIAVVIVFTPLSVCMTQAADNQCPYIFVHGFMASDIITDADDPDSEVLWPPSTDKILSVVKEHIGDVMSFLVTKDYDKLGDDIIDPVNSFLKRANLDENGEATDGSGVYFVYPEASEINKNSKLNFRYDWRVDPLETASDLNDFINYVLEASGSDKVVIECHSYGGIIVNTYSRLYGSSKLKSVCYNTTAIYGETYTGEMISGQLVISADSLTAYLKQLMGEKEYSKLVNGILDILYSAGITDEISELGNSIIEHIGDRAIRQILMPMFAHWLSIWAMIPDKYIDSSIDFVFNKLYKDDGVDHSQLRAKIDGYNTKIRPYKTQTLKQQNETVNVYVISRYGFTSVPLTPSWKKMSDTVVDTEYSSFGASCSDYDGSFSDEFIRQHSEDPMMNKDGTVYAGTCLFPEQTWFVRGLLHSQGCDTLNDFVMDLLYYDGQANVNTFENFPRFLKYTSSDGSMTADINGTVKEKQTFFDKVFAFFLKARRFITDSLNKIFSFVD